MEMSLNLQSLMDKALKKFHRAAGFFPERIILYRDGVGDKQMQSVADIEIDQIQKAC